MLPWYSSFLLAFIPLFVAIDPIGQVPVYLGLAGNVEAHHRRVAVWHAVATAFSVGICFIFLGRLIFRALGITVSDFQIAGGIILLIIAIQELVMADTQARVVSKDFGVVPLGLPMIAGPGMLTLLLTLVDTLGVVTTVTALVTNLFLVFLALRGADFLARLVGVTALRAVSRINALLLAAFAVNLIRRGWQAGG